MTPLEHRTAAESLLVKAYERFAEPDAVHALAALAAVHLQFAALPQPQQPAVPPPACPEVAVSGERCVLRPGHSEPHRMEMPA